MKIVLIFLDNILSIGVSNLTFFFLVFEILLKISEGKPWKETLLEVLPQRKFRAAGKRKRKHGDDSSNQAKKDDEMLSENDNKNESNLEEK